MKKIFILLALTISLMSCDNEVDVTANYSSFTWYTKDSRNGSENTDFSLGIEDFITLIDASTKTKTNEFIIPTSARFIKTKELIHGLDDYTQFISGEHHISNEKLINVIFTEPGVQEVVLKNTYKDSVLGAVDIEGIWTAQETFTVDVFAKLEPAFKVYTQDTSDPENPIQTEVLSVENSDLPNIDDMDSWPKVTIEAGEEIIFEDLSTIGRPSSRTWTSEGGKPETSNKDIANIKYNKLGVFMASVEVKRSGSNIPSFQATKLVPLKIEVTPSSKPFEIDGGLSINGQTISFAVTGEIEDVTGSKTNFKAQVTNANSGFDQEIPVADVTINSEDASIIELTLENPIYNTDKITISYLGGNITSVDSRSLSPFDPLTIEPGFGHSIFAADIAGFENTNTNWRKGFCKNYFIGNANGTATEPIFSRTDENLYEGEASMKFTMDGIKNISLLGTDLTKPNGVEAGTYLMSYWIYIDSNDGDETNDIKTFRTQLKTGGTLHQEEFWSLEGVERNKWVKIEQPITINALASGTKIDIRFQAADNPDTAGTQTIYFDSLSWIKLEPRP